MRASASAAALLLLPWMLLLHAEAAGNGSCARSCGALTVQYPFGFSPGCEIPLGCEDQANGTAWLGETRELGLLVHNVTARAVVLAVPQDGDRYLDRSSRCNTTNEPIRCVDHQSYLDSILRKCGLSNKMPYIKEYGSKADAKPLADIIEMSPQMLLECLKAFYGIVTGTEGSLPEFEQLQVPRLRSDACYGLARALAESYELIYSAVMDPNNSYPDPRSLVKHSPEQIRTILEI